MTRISDRALAAIAAAETALSFALLVSPERAELTDLHALQLTLIVTVGAAAVVLLIGAPAGTATEQRRLDVHYVERCALAVWGVVADDLGLEADGSTARATLSRDGSTWFVDLAVPRCDAEDVDPRIGGLLATELGIPVVASVWGSLPRGGGVPLMAIGEAVPTEPTVES